MSGINPAQDRVWSIGIYSGASPIELRPAAGVANPVLTHADVSDFPASFVADPFMVFEAGSWYMFFEVMNAVTGIGAIGLAVSRDAANWQYRRIVLKEPFHLSYPYVFRWQDEYYMVPESLGAEAVCLYRAAPFPERWLPAGSLVKGGLADPSLCRHGNQWWMFACGAPRRHDNLRLFHSADLTRGWTEAATSPLIDGDRRISRPAGRIVAWNGRIIRFAQDCESCYGKQVRAFQVDVLLPDAYHEDQAPEPVLRPDPLGRWNSSGMHHVDAHPATGETWIACVDGSVG
jgi:hypothetical protein